MSTAAATTVPSTGRLSYVPDVELFANGTHKGKDYTSADVEDMARNLRQYGELIKPPVKVGHEPPEQQPLTQGLAEADENTGTPKLGTVDWKSAKTTRSTCPACNGTGKDPEHSGEPCPSCKGEGKLTKLVAGLKDVPQGLAKLIKGRNYDRVSAEVYDQPPSGVPGTGKTLRALALLGGELPQVKTLNDVLEMHEQFAERTWPARAADLVLRSARLCPDAPGVYQVFCEVRPRPTRFAESTNMTTKWFAEDGSPAMGRDDMLKHVSSLSEARLAEVCRYSEEERTDDDPDDDDHRAYAEFSRLAEGDEPVPDDQRDRFRDFACKMGETYRKMMAKLGEKTADVPEAPTGEPPAVREPVTKPIQFSERDLKTVVAAAVAEIRKEFDPIRKDVQTFKDSTRKDAVESFVESRKKAGKVLPAEDDATAPGPYHRVLFNRLMRADALQPVHTFSEKGKTVKLTELEMQMREIDARTPRLFSEKARSGSANGNNGTAGADQDVAQVEQHYETFSENFRKVGTTKEQLVHGYKAAVKHGLARNADEYLKTT